MSPVTRTTKTQQQHTETMFARVLRSASAWMSNRPTRHDAQPRRTTEVRPEMQVTRDEECLTTHF